MKCIKKIKLSSISNVDIFWITWFILAPFLTINVFYDLMSISNHILLSLVTVILIIWAIAYMLKVKFCFIKSNFVQDIDSQKQLSSLYIEILSRVVFVFLFISQLNFLSNILLITVIIFQGILILKQRSQKQLKSIREYLKSTSSKIWQGVITIIILIISAERVIIFKI